MSQLTDEQKAYARKTGKRRYTRNRQANVVDRLIADLDEDQKIMNDIYGAMAEISGDAALLINPYNVDEMADAMYKVLTDENLRKDLIKRGLSRAKEFSWEKTARQTLDVYKEIYEKRWER